MAQQVRFVGIVLAFASVVMHPLSSYMPLEQSQCHLHQ